MSGIKSIQEIAEGLREQAGMRSQENDEAGVLLCLADQLVREVAQLECDPKNPCPDCNCIYGAV